MSGTSRMRRESHVRICERLGVRLPGPTRQLVGDFKNGGRELRPKGQPEPVRVHDFIIPELGKAVPYGVHDITANTGWVNLGINHDTAAFAVESIRRWWLAIQRQGGCMTITVCHLPPGTSKWNRIEHRLFAFITQNWRGKPLVSHQVIVQLIANTALKPAAPLPAGSTLAPIRRASRCPMTRWTLSTSSRPTSMANGTTPSLQGHLIRDAIIQAQALSCEEHLALWP